MDSEAAAAGDNTEAVETPTHEVVRRDLTAQQVADALGLKRRIIELAAAKGCPHTRERRPGNRNTLWFNADEVRAWRQAQGLDGDKLGLFAPAAAAAPASATASDPSSAASAASGDAAGGADAMVAELWAELTGLRERLREERQKGTLSSAAISQLAGAMKNIETTLSKREAALREAEDREGRVIDRPTVSRVLAELAGVFVSMLEALPMALPSVIRVALLEARARPEDADTFDRVVNVAVRDRLATERENLARQLEAAAAELEVASPASAVGGLRFEERAA